MGTGSSAERLSSLYASLARYAPGGAAVDYDRSAMIALSHAIEDEAASAEDGVLVAFFQQERRLRAELERYLTFGPRLRAVYIGAAHLPAALCGQASIIPIELRPGDPLRDEWAVILFSPHGGALLTTVETRASGSGHRRYRGFWSYDPAALAAASGVVCHLLAERGLPDVRIPAINGSPANWRSTQRLASRMVSALQQQLSAAEGRTEALAASFSALSLAQEEALFRLSTLIELRDDVTGSHLQRVGSYCAELCDALGLPAPEAHAIRLASTLHDIGKVHTPDAVLLKPGPLTTEERRLVELHTIDGARALAGARSPVLQLAHDIALMHHERWDGAGYPNGVAGEAIPLAARIVSVADVYDALTSERPYKRAFTHEEGLQLLRRGAGSQFDPEVVAAFQRRAGQIGQLAARTRAGLLNAEAGEALTRVAAPTWDPSYLVATILDRIEDSVIATDQLGRVRYWNHGAETIFGWTEAEMRGQTLERIFPAAATASLDELLEAIRSQGEIQITWVGQRKDGTPVRLFVRTQLLYGPAGAPAGFLGIGRLLSPDR